VDEATLFTLLKTINLPVAYHHFTSPPSPPYVVYLFSYSSNFGADNKVHSQADNYQVELYTKTKDPTSEALIEDLFDAHEIYWDKTETYIDSEGLYQVLYEI
jgi:hypothetical protein